MTPQSWRRYRNRPVPDAEIPSDGPYEYRVVTRDRGTVEVEGYVFATERAARATVDSIVKHVAPPYDEVWVERRPCVDWERVP